MGSNPTWGANGDIMTQKEEFKQDIINLIQMINNVVNNPNSCALETMEMMLQEPMIIILIQMYEHQFNEPFYSY